MFDLKFMQLAIDIAQKSKNDLPIGAIIVKDGQVIAKAHNEKELKNCATKHAEIIVIEEASRKLETWRLSECDLYVTLEPCPMCTWAIIQSRFKNVYFGSYDTLYGALGSRIDLRTLLNSRTKVTGGIMEKECNDIIKSYFEELRKND